MEEIRKDLLLGKPIEKILETFDWKEFEDAVAEILKRNDFKVKNNFRFKTENKYEIDIVAIKERFVVCVDCKWWKRGRYKKSGIRQAIKRQEKRIKELKKFLKRNMIAKNALGIKNQKFLSLIVTLFQEDLVKESETFVVPIWKLNSFLLGIEEYFI